MHGRQSRDDDEPGAEFLPQHMAQLPLSPEPRGTTGQRQHVVDAERGERDVAGARRHLVEEVLIVDEQHMVGRAVHALQEAVAAVIETVQHVREVVIAVTTDAIGRGCGLHEVPVLSREDQRGALFLQAEVLRFRIEYFAVAFAVDDARALVACKDRGHAGVITDRLLDVDERNHASTSRASSSAVCSASSSALAFFAVHVYPETRTILEW